MGRPRQRHKDLPRGLFKDAAGRLYLKAFTPQDRARLGGKGSLALGRDIHKARLKWAEIFGFRDQEPPAAGTIAAIFERFLDEDLVRIIRREGKPDRPKYALRTQKEYKRIAARLLALYGTRKYARSEAEAASGGFFRTMDVSAHLRAAENEGRPIQGNRDMAVMASAFRHAKECGLTEYNPCRGASRNIEEPRSQQMDDAIFLELYEEASQVLKCLLDLNVMIGCRAGDLLRIMESDWTDAGLMAIPEKRKRGQAKKKQLFKRTPDLEGVIDRALFLKKRTMARTRGKPGHKKVKSMYVFVSGPEGQPYSDSGFQSMMRAAKMRVARKRLIAAGIAKPTDQQLAQASQAIDIHFHDGRARAIDDAALSGQDATAFAGHTQDSYTARRVYQRKVHVLTPNARIKRG